MVLEQRKRTLYYHAPPMVLGTGGNDILFYFWDQAKMKQAFPVRAS